MEEKPRVLITGVSGYIGSNIALEALKSGKYQVRGTVRNKVKDKKEELLSNALGKYYNELELVEAKLLDKESLRKAVKGKNITEGCDYVLHVASPFSLEPNEDKIVPFAIEGTQSVLEACRDFKLKKCIFTSSMASIVGPDIIKPKYYDNDWVSQSSRNISPYTKSKILAEKLVWAFKKKLPQDSKLELLTINPSLVIGRFFTIIFF